MARVIGMRTEADDGRPNNTDALYPALPRCLPRALDVHSRIPRCRSPIRFFWIPCPAARKQLACFPPRACAEHKGALGAGTSLSVRDRPNSYKPSHVHRCCILPSLAVSIFFALAVTVRVFISDIQSIHAEMDMQQVLRRWLSPPRILDQVSLPVA